ncbi:hypothetical protein BDQ12DRAFT_680426 [Crucibulum laeve]|uniref:Uncharacterized protein n=1 Tax=Crucibulum laeve TaxID=68775 RepID=A0A5C3M650_9AGAR|nr:hypothetical protein BDQ12DRAFT_680426 [Crucibulum laeve]
MSLISLKNLQLPPSALLAESSSRNHPIFHGEGLGAKTNKIQEGELFEKLISERSRGGDSLPPYVTDASLPAYSPGRYVLHPEPNTLARVLFKLGFLFPPLWLLGTLSLICPLRVSRDSSHPKYFDKPDTEQTSLYASVRDVEIKWGKRCLAALLILMCVGIAVGISLWGAMKMKRQNA